MLTRALRILESPEPVGALTSTMLEVLNTGTLAHLAVDTGRGPLVTPVLYGVAEGRIYMLIRLNTAKGRALTRRPRAGVSVTVGSRSVALRGHVTLCSMSTVSTLGSLIPLARLATPGLASWALRNPRHIAGFALDTRKALAVSGLQDMALVVVTPDASVLIEEGEVVGSTGTWPIASKSAQPSHTLVNPSLWSGLVPADLRPLVRESTTASLGVLTASGAIVLPVGWNANTAQVTIPAGVLAPSKYAMPSCLTVAAEVRNRASHQRGVVLRGTTRCTDDDHLLLTARRANWWDGFRTGTSEHRGSLAA